MAKIMLLSTLLILAAPLAWAEDAAATRVSYLLPAARGGAVPPAPATVSSDEQLNLRAADFTAFAKVKIQEMSRNLLASRENMQIRRQKDGSYRAIYHQIDDTSLSCEVSRSRLRTVPYVAVLSYREQIYAASCATHEECARQQFEPVDVIPNRHIFTYSKGAWN